MTTTWPPLPCYARACVNRASHAVTGPTLAIASCRHHLDAARKKCGPGEVTVTELDDATEPDQPSLYDDEEPTP